MTTIIPGRSRENARAVLAAAERAKVDPTLVRTVQKGYAVPDKVAEEYRNGAPKVKAEPKTEAKVAHKARRSAKSKSEPEANETEAQEEAKDEEQSEDKATDPEEGE